MPHHLSNVQIETVVREAERAACACVRKTRQSNHQQDDVRQELLADAFQRLDAFDSKRGTLGAFVGTIMANKATRIAGAVSRERRLFGQVSISIDDPVGDDQNLTLGDTIGEAQGYSAFFGQDTDAFDTVDARLDVERGLALLSTADQETCRSLTVSSVDELVARGAGSRSSLYRRVGRIRLDLTAAGLDGGAG